MKYLDDLVKTSTLIFNLPSQYIKDNVDRLLQICISGSATSRHAVANAIFLLTRVLEDRSLHLFQYSSFFQPYTELIAAIDRKDRNLYQVYGFNSLLFLDSNSDQSDDLSITGDSIEMDLILRIDYQPETVLRVIERCNDLSRDKPELWSSYLKKRYDLYFDILYCELGRCDFPRSILESCLKTRPNREISDSLGNYKDDYRVGIVEDSKLLEIGVMIDSNTHIVPGAVKDEILEEVRRDIVAVRHDREPAFIEKNRNVNRRKLRKYKRRLETIYKCPIRVANMTHPEYGFPMEDLNPADLILTCNKDGEIFQLSSDMGHIHQCYELVKRAGVDHQVLTELGSNSFFSSHTRQRPMIEQCREIACGRPSDNQPIGSFLKLGNRISIPKYSIPIEGSADERASVSLRDGSMKEKTLRSIRDVIKDVDRFSV